MSHFFFLDGAPERVDRLAFELAQACQPKASAFGFIAAELIGAIAPLKDASASGRPPLERS
jgi:hypothetical protein